MRLFGTGLNHSFKLVDLIAHLHELLVLAGKLLDEGLLKLLRIYDQVVDQIRNIMNLNLLHVC